MRSLKASFLLIGPWDPSLQELGAHIASDLQQAWHWIQDSTYDVIAVSITLILGKKFSEFYEEIKNSSPATQFIAVVPADFSAHQLANLHENFSFYRVMTDYHDHDIEAHLFAALEESSQRKQDDNLAVLIREQTAQLKQLQVELEDRVQKRTKFLTEARRKLFLTNSRIEAFKRALMAVHQASSIGEIEHLLNESMTNAVQTSWIRLFFHPQDEIFSRQAQIQLDFTLLQVPLFRHHEKIGSLIFLRPPNCPFTKEENNFLIRVTEAVSLALDRIQKLKESEFLKEQWEATFNSMSDPVVMIDANHDIIQSNKALNEKLSERNKDQGSRKCYEILFNRSTPCTDCQRGKNFRIRSSCNEMQNFEVYSQSLTLDSEQPSVFVNLYHDITQQLKMEKQILESAKMAELGTIGSSIAHELNNPLGGILSFTQLIKMDMDPKDQFYPDIVEMEAGVNRCKEIVQNLLGFARNPNADLNGNINLKDVCLRALKIVEFQTKSKGIEVRIHLPAEEKIFHGHFNLLSQAVKNILQNAIDRITERIQIEKGIKGILDIELSGNEENIIIAISDNGTKEKATGSSSTLGISIASQILRDHDCYTDCVTLDNKNTARIYFPLSSKKNSN